MRAREALEGGIVRCCHLAEFSMSSPRLKYKPWWSESGFFPKHILTRGATWGGFWSSGYAYVDWLINNENQSWILVWKSKISARFSKWHLFGSTEMNRLGRISNSARLQTQTEYILCTQSRRAFSGKEIRGLLLSKKSSIKVTCSIFIWVLLSIDLPGLFYTHPRL